VALGNDHISGRTNVRLREFSKSLPMSLLKAREAVMQRFRSSLRMFNITEQQWRVLRALTSVDEIEVTALAHASFLLTPSLSRILKDLEDRHLIKRRQDPEDLRRSRVSISRDGMRLIATVAPFSEAIYGEITRTFGAENMALLQNLLKELETRMAELPPFQISAGDLGEEVTPLVGPKRRGRPRKSAV
jgi:homoprotocatechuate degradation regulator HpaR